MKRAVVLALLMLVTAAEAGTGLVFLSAKGPIPLNSGQGLRLLQQCSRPAPTSEGLIWLPNAKEIAQLEVDLPAYLNLVRSNEGRTPPVPPHYRGQYVSYTVRGQPRIYASFVPESAAEPAGVTDGSALLVCDGGNQFWGVVYDPATRAFSDLQFNGPK